MISGKCQRENKKWEGQNTTIYYELCADTRANISRTFGETASRKSRRCNNGWRQKLDRGSKRSSPRFGLITPYRLTNRNSARLFHHVLIYMGDLHFVLPALNLSNLDADILIMVQQVRLMMFSLNMVEYSISFLSLST